MQVPRLLDYTNYLEFFNDFFLINKKSNPNFSFEYFARKIKWPKSALPDFLSKRRVLSIRRAIEFSNYFNLDALDTEIIIFWAVEATAGKESELPKSFNNLFTFDWKNKNNEKLIQKIEYPHPGDEVNSHSFLSVYTLLLHTNKFRSIEHIIEALPVTCNLNEQKVQKILDMMQEQGLLETKKGQGYVFKNKDIFIDFSNKTGNVPEDFKIDKGIIEAFKTASNYMQNPIICEHYTTFGLVRVKKDKVKELSRRLAHISNWICSQDSFDGTDNYQDYQLYQLNTALFPLIENDYQLPEETD